MWSSHPAKPPRPLSKMESGAVYLLEVWEKAVDEHRGSLTLTIDDRLYAACVDDGVARPIKIEDRDDITGMHRTTFDLIQFHRLAAHYCAGIGATEDVRGFLTFTDGFQVPLKFKAPPTQTPPNTKKKENQ